MVDFGWREADSLKCSRCVRDYIMSVPGVNEILARPVVLGEKVSRLLSVELILHQ